MIVPGIIQRKATVEFRAICVGVKTNPTCVQTIHLGQYDNSYDPDNPHKPIKQATDKLKHDYGWIGRSGLWMCPSCQYVREQSIAESSASGQQAGERGGTPAQEAGQAGAERPGKEAT